MQESPRVREERIRTMKEIIRHLHRGEAPEAVKARLKELVRRTEASEIMAMEQELISEGIPPEEIRKMCDLHSAVLREILAEEKAKRKEVPPGHPLDTFRRENEALALTAAKLREMTRELASLPPGAEVGERLLSLQQLYNDLMDLEKHYQRKENLLFSCLERHGVVGPSRVMWGKDDEVRGKLSSLGAAIGSSGSGLTAGEFRARIQPSAEATLDALEEMIYKEENILLPMAADSLTEEEWGEIWAQSPEYGWCLVEPREGYRPLTSESPPTGAGAPREAVTFPTGSLSQEEIGAIFETLPLEITFVDSEDRVRFFSTGKHRIFARSKAILGRKVQHCHPPKSVGTVNRILDDFRSGRQSVAEFWINFRDRLVHIRYLAVRSPADKYLGCLELVQDVTRLRALEGERRLLQYDEQEKGT